ncbi:MAG: phenylalanine--tRNA ligase subunit beta [Streptococcaceae bacterium]|jgi:phenylalanyl-tRNA synthetase beta chain|nr:phenylalanine--tRNA ligase subunit beta [Streptococcaceae bacterium]
MLVSKKWLNTLVPGIADLDAQVLADKISTTGIEVEDVTTPQEGLKDLVVGEIKSFEDVPETHLHVCQVDAGQPDGDLQIVCGAPNVRVGMKAIVALIGARVGGNTKIKKGKMRGFESQGMLCALDELGISDKINPMKHEEGIYEMPQDAVNGESIFPYLDMDDSVLDLDVLANRADALSMRGVAYEVSAIYESPVAFEKHDLVESTKAASSAVKVIVSSEKCKTYKLRVIEGVKIAKSPLWLQNRLMNAGVKPINNVVDVTNYVLMYYGQPLHSFDFGTFTTPEITVRDAKAAEKITTLDGEERELTPDDLVITSNSIPIALAGVMGGLDTEITEATTSVALEAAIFDPTSVRKTSQKFALRSEASSRFEKGINEGTVREALDFAAALIQELAGGEVLAGVVASNNYQPEPVRVAITLEKINRSLGTDLSSVEVLAIFHRLGLENTGSGENYVLQIPSRRWDLHIEADIVEEVARIYGYDKLPSTLPATGGTVGLKNASQRLRDHVRTVLEASGLSEVIGYSLTSPEKAVEFLPKDFPVTSLLLPMTEDRQTLRVNMISGLLDTIAYNQNRKQADVAIYEIGNTFLPSESEDGRPKEVPNVAFALSGLVTGHLHSAGDHELHAADFWDAKGVMEKLLAGYENITFEAVTDNPAMHPGRTAVVKIDGQIAGFVGQIHPATAKKYGVAETVTGVLDLGLLLEKAPAQAIFKEIPKIPAVARDVALLVDDKTSNSEVVAAIEEAGVKTLVAIKLFDLYQGDNVPAGKKSLAYSLTFQALEETMTDEQIESAMKKISQALEAIGAEIR